MDEQLKHLYDYTKFHIGMYATLVAGTIGIFANSTLNSQYQIFLYFVVFTVIFYSFAGMFGGLIASSIPYSSKLENFLEEQLSPDWLLRWFPRLKIKASNAISAEHICFWIGSAIAVVGLIVTITFGKPHQSQITDQSQVTDQSK